MQSEPISRDGEPGAVQRVVGCHSPLLQNAVGTILQSSRSLCPPQAGNTLEATRFGSLFFCLPPTSADQWPRESLCCSRLCSRVPAVSAASRLRWSKAPLHKASIHGCVQGNEAEINQAVENALSNLMALAERGDIEFDGPEDRAHVAEQMIRASIDRMGIEDVVGLSVTCVGVE